MAYFAGQIAGGFLIMWIISGICGRYLFLEKPAANRAALSVICAWAVGFVFGGRAFGIDAALLVFTPLAILIGALRFAAYRRQDEK